MDDLKARVLEGIRIGLAARELPKSQKAVYGGYNVDSTTENGVTQPSVCNTEKSNDINDVTPVHRVLPNMEVSQENGNQGDHRIPSTALADPGVPYSRTLAALQQKCPDYVEVDRWQQAVSDGRAFVTTWGLQAQALGWTPRDLFGLHTPPPSPHPSYQRLSRYDETGLCWLLDGRPVTLLSSTSAVIQNPTGNITTYRKDNKPALGPVGDSLDDLIA